MASKTINPPAGRQESEDAAVFSKTLTLTFRWRCAAFPCGLPARLQEALEETAVEHAFGMLRKGFTSGELIDYVNMKFPRVKTPEDGFHCTGWFEFA